MFAKTMFARLLCLLLSLDCALTSRLPTMRTISRLRGGAADVSLGSDDEKSMYALGCNVGRQLGDLACLSSSDLDRVLLGMKDVLTRSPMQVDLATYLPKAATYFKGKQDEETEKMVKAGKEALAAASAKKGAVTTDSGLVVETLKKGKGGKPKATDKVRVHYEGKLLDGTVFDSSIRRGEPAELPLEAVVAGWSEGLQLMQVGEKAVLTIPSDLAYGDQGKSVIPPKATLIFEIELLEIVEQEAADDSSDDDLGLN